MSLCIYSYVLSFSNLQLVLSPYVMTDSCMVWWKITSDLYKTWRDLNGDGWPMYQQQYHGISLESNVDTYIYSICYIVSIKTCICMYASSDALHFYSTFSYWFIYVYWPINYRAILISISTLNIMRMYFKVVRDEI